MANKRWTQVATRTGRVLQILSLPDTLEDYDNHHTTLFPGTIDGETHYLADGKPTARPTQSSTIDRSEVVVSEFEKAILSNLPQPCVVHVSGPTGYNRIDVPEGSMQFSAGLPGRYTLTVEAFPYLNAEFTVNAL